MYIVHASKCFRLNPEYISKLF